MRDILDTCGAIDDIREILELSRHKTEHLVQWQEASSTCRPALVFIPGFLSEKSGHSDFGIWTERMVSLAQERDWAAYGLYWPSMKTSDLVAAVDWLDLCHRMLQNPNRPWYMHLSASLEQCLNIHHVWKQAIQNADSIGSHPERWLGELRRPIILMGHSLGGRIALQTAMSQCRLHLLQVGAFAPAMLASECDFEKISAGQERESMIFHSQNDATLRYLFRVGEFTSKLPLGLEGVPRTKSSRVQSIDVSEYKARKMGHNDYASVCVELIQDFL